MLGRKTFAPDEIAAAKTAVKQQVAVYKKVAAAAGKGAAAVGDAEPVYFNTALVALDRRFVYRLRMVSGKSTNALNEVEMLVDSLMNNAGVLRSMSAISYQPAEAVLGLEVGDAIKLHRAGFEKLTAAFFADLERLFA